MRTSALIVMAGLATASVASAQTVASFTLNDGAFRYHEGAGLNSAAGRTGTGTGSASNFGFASGAATATTVTSDYLFQNWFWYRSAGDTREYALSGQTLGTQLSGNSAFLRYVEPIGNNAAANGTLGFELTYTLNQISATQAAVTINWSIVNNTQSDQPVSFFAYADSDIGASGSNFGTYTAGSGVNYLRNDVSNVNNTQFFTMSADLRLDDAWQIGPFGTGANSPRDALANAVVNNLNGTVSPFTGDFSGALQFDVIVPAGGTVGGRVTKGYNYIVPAPGAMALLGLGGLAAARRRR